MFKGCLFLLAACPTGQAVCRPDFRPCSFRASALVQWTSCTSALCSPAQRFSRERRGPGICSLDFWAVLPPWRKSRANKSRIKLNYPRGWGWRRTMLGIINLAMTSLPGTVRMAGLGACVQQPRSPTQDCNGQWKSNSPVTTKSRAGGPFTIVCAQLLMSPTRGPGGGPGKHRAGASLTSVRKYMSAGVSWTRLRLI